VCHELCVPDDDTNAHLIAELGKRSEALQSFLLMVYRHENLSLESAEGI
jgi:hypothetical protein